MKDSLFDLQYFGSELFESNTNLKRIEVKEPILAQLNPCHMGHVQSFLMEIKEYINHL